MEINITQKDISSELCQRCAACCDVWLTVPNVDPRYRMFLRQRGLKMDPPPKEGQPDCCEKNHDVKVAAPDCRHMERFEENGDVRYRCKAYGTSDFPQLCSDFDCVSWARHGNQYNDSNKLLVAAQTALNFMRMEKGHAK